MILRKGDVHIIETDDDEIAALQWIVENKQCATIRRKGEKRGLFVDLFSASAVMRVDSGINEANRAKFRALPLGARIQAAFKIIDGAKRLAGK